MNLSSRIALVLLFFCLGCSPSEGPQEAETTIPDLSDVVQWDEIEEEIASNLSDMPSEGFVPDERTATEIAEAVSIALYGEDVTALEKPFRARLDEGIWTVVGYLPSGMEGGVALIRIRKSDGGIVFAMHEDLPRVGN